jgi:hypothetical protein
MKIEFLRGEVIGTRYLINELEKFFPQLLRIIRFHYSLNTFLNITLMIDNIVLLKLFLSSFYYQCRLFPCLNLNLLSYLIILVIDLLKHHQPILNMPIYYHLYSLHQMQTHLNPLKSIFIVSS